MLHTLRVVVPVEWQLLLSQNTSLSSRIMACGSQTTRKAHALYMTSQRCETIYISAKILCVKPIAQA